MIVVSINYFVRGIANTLIKSMLKQSNFTHTIYNYTMSSDMTMRLNDSDITRLVKACQLYQEKTGSEYMWDEYNDLIQKLNTYKEQYSVSK